MATRPLFVPYPAHADRVEIRNLRFEWFSGFAVSQKQKSIRSLHEAARMAGFKSPLEISSKSEDPLGVELSAFNLTVRLAETEISVESAFQGSKVFAAGSVADLYDKPPREAKRDPRLTTSGPLEAFDIYGERWPLQPLTAFYDWLYLSALCQHPDSAKRLLEYDSFTDIEFNPKRSINCQARSAALYVSLSKAALLDSAMTSKDDFLAVLGSETKLGF